jgi:hypothetical protein
VEDRRDAEVTVIRSLTGDDERPVKRDPDHKQSTRPEGGEEEEPQKPPPAWLQGELA